jgi:hypothetical protein
MANTDRERPSTSRGCRTGAPLVAFVLAFPLAAGCGEQFEAGLANAPSMQRTSVPVRHHDVIANADDSCPRATGGNDPLPNRAPPCNELHPGDAGGPEGLPDSAIGARQ